MKERCFFLDEDFLCGFSLRVKCNMPRVYVGRLSYHVREKDIQRFFSGYGKLLEIDLKNG